MEKKPVRVHLLGCGDLGTAIAQTLLARGDEPLALRRNTDALPSHLPSLPLDYTEPLQPDITLLTPTPPGRDIEAYRQGYLRPVENWLALRRDGPPQALIHVSSTRVYGDAGGAWVDEDSSLCPADGQAEVLAEAEQRLQESHHRICVVRFSGIYGRLPSRLLQRISGGDIVKAEPPHFSNRIHREDCIGFLLHLLDTPDRKHLYLASDDLPALSHEVESWLARRLGVAHVRETVTPPAANRRCRNARMKASGYRLRYPDFRAGYSAMMASTSMSTPLGKAAT
jgi:nucleoside-diphosphate-sugar epimerase